MPGRRLKNLRVALRLLIVVGAAFVAGSAGGCNKADFTDTQTGGCREAKCTCEEDPLQPTCKGFNGRPEFESGLPEAMPVFNDANAGNDASDAADADDAASDALADGGDEAG